MNWRETGLRLLLTNDDGVYAEGLQELRHALEAAGEHEVFVVAPERERSAASHAITLHKPLYVHRVKIYDSETPTWSVSGTPADCVKMAVQALLDRPPDLILSGINRGANLGMDVLYSGTVSAAIEGVILGLPAVAVSLATFSDADYTFAARFTVDLVRQVQRDGLPGGTLLNVNIPALEEGQIAGIAATRLGLRYYDDKFHPRRDPRGREYYWLAGQVRHGKEEPDTDVGALEQNLISITPLHLRLTDTEMLGRMSEWVAVLEPRYVRE